MSFFSPFFSPLFNYLLSINSCFLLSYRSSSLQLLAATLPVPFKSKSKWGKGGKEEEGRKEWH
jgi:hypothetical protein